MTTHRPMLAVAGAPPAHYRWSEFKWDGHRTNITTGPPAARLTSRGGHVVTARYPEVAAAITEVLGDRHVELDGELVAPGPGGVPDFERLQARARTAVTAARVAARPVNFVAFDLLALDGVDLTSRPLSARRALLDGLGLETHPRLLCSPVFTDVDPAVLLEVARARQVEGIVTKRPSAAYASGRRSKAWIKTVLTETAVFVVAGWARGRSRHPEGVGSLLLGAPTPGGGLAYVGEVGTGWSRAEHTRLVAALAELATPVCPFTENTAALPATARFAVPQLHGLVAYREHRPGRLLRHPAWKGLTDTAGT